MLRLDGTKKRLIWALAVLCLCQPLLSLQAFAGGVPRHQLKKIPAAPVPESYVRLFCEQNTYQACVIAQAWSWYRSEDIYIDLALKTVALSGTAWSLAFVASKLVGNTSEVQFIFTSAGAGEEAGAIMLVGTVGTIVLAAAVSAAVIFEQNRTHIYFDDKPQLAMQCSGVDLKFLDTPAGQEKLQTMSLDEADKILPCIPADKDLSSVMIQGAESGKRLLADNPSNRNSN